MSCLRPLILSKRWAVKGYWQKSIITKSRT
ncbi:Uncharacterised protein [Vibrio cholerae]|nr:Uncharacterised protein [Vibrio cholerae]